MVRIISGTFIKKECCYQYETLLHRYKLNRPAVKTQYDDFNTFPESYTWQGEYDEHISHVDSSDACQETFMFRLYSTKHTYKHFVPLTHLYHGFK